MLSPELVLILDYDPAWKNLFKEERAMLERAFSGISCTIEHVGSTAVEGLGAKPIVDIMIGVDSIRDVEQCLDRLDALDYSYEPLHEQAIPERRFFRKPKQGPHQFHLHCVPRNSDFFRDHVMFRDMLAQDPETAAEYEALKKDLAEKLPTDRAAYTEAKTEFIAAVLEKATGKP